MKCWFIADARSLLMLFTLPAMVLAGEPLIVVEDLGGASALPYYKALNLQPRTSASAKPPSLYRYRPPKQ